MEVLEHVFTAGLPVLGDESMTAVRRFGVAVHVGLAVSARLGHRNDTRHRQPAFSMHSDPRIVVASRDPHSIEHFVRALVGEGHSVEIVRTGRELRTTIEDASPSLALIELALADQRGTEILRDLRAEDAHAALPIVLVSERADEIDRVVAFELGADDFVERSMSPRELALRVRAILGRVRPKGVWSSPERCAVGPFEIDRVRHTLCVDGAPVAVTPLELELMSRLAARAGRVETRESLVQHVWERSIDAPSRVVDTSIKRLRKKLGSHGDWIETVRGVGYRLRDTEQAL
jgi:two-component system phosphate regulon response regulator PhoB